MFDLPSPLSIYHHSVRSTTTTLHLSLQCSIYHHHSLFTITVFDLPSPLSIYHHCVDIYRVAKSGFRVMVAGASVMGNEASVMENGF